MEGEASQKVITGARGTPPISNAATTGMTDAEHNGLNAPKDADRKIAMIGRALNDRLIYLDIPDIFTPTAMGIVISKYGQVWIKFSKM
jgi:hypothetical protein